MTARTCSPEQPTRNVNPMPNRILRDWTTSDRINQTSHEEEAFFTRLLMAVDDYGRFTADPRLLLARLFPLRIGKTDAKRVHSIRDALAAHMLITLYVVDGREFLQVTNWQNVPRAKGSRFPECTADAQQMHSTCIASAPVTVTVTDDRNRKPEPITETDLLREGKAGKRFSYSPDFEEAWKAWPANRKGEKGAAFKAWNKCASRPPLESILASIEAHKQHSAKWLDGFNPEMVNWINGRGFDNTFDPNNKEWRP